MAERLIQYGEIIAFVLSATSILFALIASIQTPTIQESSITDDIRFHKASIIINNQSSTKLEKLWALNVLRYNSLLENEYGKITKGISRDSSCEDALYKICIENANNTMAILDYNTGLKKITAYLSNKSKSEHVNLDDLSWYTLKLASLEGERNNNLRSQPLFNSTNWKEDISCMDVKDKNSHLDDSDKGYYYDLFTKKTHNDRCTFGELKQITERINTIITQGDSSDYYNYTKKVFVLNELFYNFVNYFNYFVIFSLIGGPIIFIVGIKHYNEK